MSVHSHDTFKRAQKEYEAHGILLFPVGENKRPSVKGWNSVDREKSRAWARTFPSASRFAFLAGKQSGVTVLDIDEPGENALADALSVHGETSIIARTGSGCWHAWYRHAGERRLIKSAGPHLDILGEGMAIAPPSDGYEFVQGGLRDLDSLPSMMRQAAPHAVIHEGRRNNELFRFCLRQAPACDDFEALLDCAETWADNWCSETLPPSEIAKVAQSAWRYEANGENWVGYGERVTLNFEDIDRLAAFHPDAFALYSILKRYHQNQESFIMANAMAEKHCGWTLPRWRKARDVLIKAGLIECIYAGGRGAGDPPIYRFK